MSKQNDYFLNQLYNPEFSPGDFQTVGLNSGNTSIENKDEYKKLDFVQNNPLLQTDGKFDENKFDRLYNKPIPQVKKSLCSPPVQREPQAQVP